MTFHAIVHPAAEIVIIQGTRKVPENGATSSKELISFQIKLRSPCLETAVKCPAQVGDKNN